MANQIGKITVNPYTLTADTATVTVSANLNRRYLAIINGSVGILYYKFTEDSQATVQSDGITTMEEVPASTSLLFDVLAIPTGTLYLRSVAGDAVKVSEGV